MNKILRRSLLLGRKLAAIVALLIVALLIVALLIVAHDQSPTSLVRHTAHASMATVRAAGSEQADGPVCGDLVPEAPINNREIQAGEQHHYRICLTSGKYLALSIDKGDLHLIVRALDPSGRKIVEAGNQTGISVELAIISDMGGPYRIEVESLEQGEYVGRYGLRIKQLHEAQPDDPISMLAAQSFQAGHNLRDEWKEVSLKEAIGKYEQARRLWRSVNDLQGEEVALLAMASANVELSASRQALRYYKSALRLSRLIADSRAEIKALNGIGYLLIDTGRFQESLAHSSDARRISKKIGDQAGLGTALNNIALAYYSTGRQAESVAVLKQAESLLKASLDRRGQAEAQLNLGYSYYDLGDPDEAFQSWQHALGLFTKIKDKRGQALTLTALGKASGLFGDEQKGLEYHYQALDSFRTLGNHYGEVVALNGIASTFRRIGEDEKALSLFNQSLQLSQALGYRHFEEVILIVLGETYLSLGNKRMALACYTRRLVYCRASKNRRVEAYMLNGIGNLYEYAGRLSRALTYYNRALRLGREVSDRRGQAYTLRSIGSIYEKLRQRRRALIFYNKSLALMRTVEDHAGETVSLFNVAKTKRHLGDLRGASASASLLIEMVESLRSKIAGTELRRSFSASVHDYYDLHIDLLMQMRKASPSAEFAETAVEFSEKARARSLLDMLTELRAGIRQGADPALLERQQSLQRAINAKADRQMRLLNGAFSPKEVAAVKEEIANLTMQYEALEAQIRVGNPRYSALTQPGVLSLAEIQQQLLEPGSLLLEYFLGERQSYLWVIGRNSMESYQLPCKAKIETAVRDLYEILRLPPSQSTSANEVMLADTEDRYVRASAKLSAMILGPAAQRLHAERLIIVADGALQYIPFASLFNPCRKAGDAGFQQPLMIDHEIVSLPSASALTEIRRDVVNSAARPKSIAVFSDPVFDRFDSRVQSGDLSRVGETLSTQAQRSGPFTDDQAERQPVFFQRLIYTRQEAEKISALVPDTKCRLFLDFEASRSAVISDEIQRYSIIHFATHTILSNSHPELSGVVLSLVDRNGNSQDGFLRLIEIYNLKLSAELVVLSACDTALGKQFEGEGLVGLTRGFMYAGVPRVVASLWAVNDRATEELIGYFYEGILGNERLTPAQALRRAQIEMWKQKPWVYPYYWAGFVLQGDWK